MPKRRRNIKTIAARKKKKLQSLFEVKVLHNNMPPKEMHEKDPEHEKNKEHEKDKEHEKEAEHMKHQEHEKGPDQEKNVTDSEPVKLPSKEELSRIKLPRPKRLGTPEIFFRDVSKDMIVSALRNGLKKEFPKQSKDVEKFKNNDIIKIFRIGPQALRLASDACLDNLIEVVRNGFQYTNRSNRKRFTIKDFEKGLNFYQW